MDGARPRKAAKAAKSAGGSVAKRAKPRKATTKSSAASASKLIDARIATLKDWRGDTLSKLRALIRAADPQVIEEWKWEVPVWSHDGLICTGETYKQVVKLTFPKGAQLKDPKRLFNSSLEGNVRRAIDFREGQSIDEASFKALIQEAATLNSRQRRGS